MPNVPEALLMIRSIRDVNSPKLLSPDVPLFDAILEDLFPSVCAWKLRVSTPHD
jgi:dynein heavy chain